MSKLLVAVAILAGMLALPAHAAAPEMPTPSAVSTSPTLAAPKAAEAKATDQAKTTTAPAAMTAGTPTGVSVDASSQCEVVAASNAAEIVELRKQIQALQAQILNQPNLANASVKDYSIRFKHLPPGSYRDRCFACMTAADEDAERVLLCTCPTGENSFDRLSLILSKCQPEEEISYCAGMLMCGPCHLNNNLRKELPTEKTTVPSDAERLDKFLNLKK